MIISPTKADTLSSSMAAAIAALAAETDSAKQDAGFRAWLTSMSRFHRYSWGNQLLIAIQCPNATRVAGFQAWLKLGRYVKKGEKGIGILAPILRQVSSAAKGQNNRGLKPSEKGVQELLGFRGATVFDMAQTDGNPLPEAPEHNATEGGEALLPKLEAAAASWGIAVAYEAIPGSIQGYSMGGHVVIEQTLPTPAKCGTPAHELAHELLHHGPERANKQQRELEAEATAYVVLAHLRMGSGSRFYLSSYGITGEMLSASLGVIASTARRMIEQVEGKSITEEGAEDAPGTRMLAEAA